MDRAEFTKKVLDQILFVVSSTQSYTEKIMAARKGRVDSASFQKWLIEERDKALSEPDFNPFDAVMKKWMGEPDAAALHLADTINFHFDGAVDWAEIWKQAKWILAGIPDGAVDLEQSIRQPFLIYRNVLKAETAAKVFSEQLEQKPKREPKPEPKTLDWYFKESSDMERWLSASAKAGVIATDGDGYQWGRIEPKTHGICAMWFAAKDAGFIKEKAKNSEAITNAIRVFLKMERLSKDTIGNVNHFDEDFKRIKKAIEKNQKLSN